MVHLVSTWLLVAGLVGAGLVNVMSSTATQNSFVHWGYPSWWGRLTGGLEIVGAGLVALPATRSAGLALSAVIIAAALTTVLGHRAYQHLPPLALFGGLIVMVLIG